MSDKWIEWEGGWKNPVDGRKVVEVRFRCGKSDKRRAGALNWEHADAANDYYDIIAYRVVSA